MSGLDARLSKLMPALSGKERATLVLKAWKDEGLLVVGLDADGSVDIDSLELASEPLVIVLGSEGRGLSRLVRETCDATVSIPMAAGVESLNAATAAAVALYAWRRQAAGPTSP